MGEVKNEVQVTFSEQLTDKLVAVGEALPKDFNKTRSVQNCLSVMNDNPGLAKINRSHVIAGLLKAAYLGLDPLNKECYLIPYGNTVQFQTDYKGDQKFVKRYAIRPVLDIFAKVVREGDFFEEGIVDNKPVVNFKPVPFSNKDIVGAFAIVLFKDGGMLYEAMSTADIQSVRNNYSKAANSKAWKYSFDEMAKKTVLRRLCKHIETDFESVEARQAWEDGAGMEFTQSGKPMEEEPIVDAFAKENVIDVEMEEIVDEDEMVVPEVFK